jgi:FkbM family methyltransferase
MKKSRSRNKLKKMKVNVKRYGYMNLCVRPNTTDDKVITEVLQTCVYEKPSIDFFIEENEKWLDLGGNIGTFALLCLARNSKVVSYEPEKENFELMKKNIELNFPANANIRLKNEAVGTKTGTTELYLCKGNYNKYRHTIYKKKGRESITIPIKSIISILSKTRFDCIKMDIEGAEIDILEFLKPSDYKKYGIKKMVFEYSFDIDNSIPRFLKIMNRLKKYFKNVHWTKVKENELTYNYFPAATLVFCYM